MRDAFAISIVRFNTKRKNVVWAPAFGGPIGFSLVSLMDNTALGEGRGLWLLNPKESSYNYFIAHSNC